MPTEFDSHRLTPVDSPITELTSQVVNSSSEPGDSRAELSVIDKRAGHL